MDLLLTDYNYDDYFFMACLACNAKRYHEAFPVLLAIMDHEVNYNEVLIDLIQICFKNIITPLRESWILLNTIKNDLMSSQPNKLDVNAMRKEIEDSLRRYLSYKERIDIKIQYSIGLDDSTYVLLKRLKADFCRYSHELSGDKEQSNELYEAEEAYEQVYNFVIKHFKPISEEVLSTALNYSVFIDQYLKDKSKALDLATSCYISAQNYLARYDLEIKHKAAKLLRLLQKNMEVWQRVTEDHN